LSFETISSVGANGAIIHYSPKSDTCAEMQPDGMYLCDSGGQVRFQQYVVFAQL
jgi:Xaa-Pro aminopeptidase